MSVEEKVLQEWLLARLNASASISQTLLGQKCLLLCGRVSLGERPARKHKTKLAHQVSNVVDDIEGLSVAASSENANVAAESQETKRGPPRVARTT